MGIFQNTGPTPKAKDGFIWVQEPVQKIPQEKASEVHCVRAAAAAPDRMCSQDSASSRSHAHVLSLGTWVLGTVWHR